MSDTNPPAEPTSDEPTTSVPTSNTAVGEMAVDVDDRWWRGVGRVRRRRSVRAAAVLAVLVLVAGAGYLAGRRVADRSEAAEERTRPPAPTALTEPVVEARIAPSVSGPTKVSAGPRTEVDCVPATEGDARQVFTVAPVRSGTEVTEGQILAAVNGRPVIALAGAVPAYRDLRPDERGSDVTQLQQALARLGFGDGTVDGHYGPATWDAVRALYEARGYEPVGPTPEEVAALDAAAAEVDGAVRRADAAVTQEEYDRARADRDAARDRLASLEAVTGPSVPFCEIVFVPSLPAVAGVARSGGDPDEAEAAPDTAGPGDAGTPATVTSGTPWLTLGTGDPTAELVVSASVARTLKPGLTATLVASTGRARLTGEVREVREGTPAVAVVAFAGADPALDGVSGTLTVTLPAPEEPVLAVSVAAPIQAANGTTTVTRVGRDGTRRSVRIETGTTDGALVEVTSSEPALRVGDELLVGVRGG